MALDPQLRAKLAAEREAIEKAAWDALSPRAKDALAGAHSGELTVEQCNKIMLEEINKAAAAKGLPLLSKDDFAGGKDA